LTGAETDRKRSDWDIVEAWFGTVCAGCAVPQRAGKVNAGMGKVFVYQNTSYRLMCMECKLLK
jgi:hypothetical protein